MDTKKTLFTRISLCNLRYTYFVCAHDLLTNIGFKINIFVSDSGGGGLKLYDHLRTHVKISSLAMNKICI